MISKKKIAIVAVGAVVAAFLVVTQTAWTNQHHGPKRLGGSWVGQLQGIQWTGIMTPLDPEGRTATDRVKFETWNADIAALMQFLGAQTVSEGVGELAMIDRDTAKFTYVMYTVTQANPPEIKAIFLVNGTWDFTGRDTAMSAETVLVYSPLADANHDGLPDSNATPMLPPMVFPPALNVRVPIMP